MFPATTGNFSANGHLVGKSDVEDDDAVDIPHICHFFYTDRIFENQILHPKKTTKITKNTKNVFEKVIYMHFFHSFWKNLHLTEIFYTDMSVVSVTNKRYGWHMFYIFYGHE